MNTQWVYELDYACLRRLGGFRARWWNLRRHRSWYPRWGGRWSVLIRAMSLSRDRWPRHPLGVPNLLRLSLRLWGLLSSLPLLCHPSLLISQVPVPVSVKITDKFVSLPIVVAVSKFWVMNVKVPEHCVFECSVVVAPLIEYYWSHRHAYLHENIS